MNYIVDNNLNFEDIPKQPGCYIFRNKLQYIIYIGKSKSLHKRIKQHFSNKDADDYKHIDMMKELHSFELILTDTETNALILECRLIKQHKPKYNSQLKNGRAFPFIRINLRQKYPAITIENSIEKEGGKYYGSFYDRDDAFAAIELISSIWQTPICCAESFDKHQRPCLNYHLNKCCAPCGGVIDDVTYRNKIDEIVKCLDGNFRSVVSRLKKEMVAASDDMNFEMAALLRDNFLGLNKIKKRLKSLCTDMDNKNLFLFFRAYGEKCFSLFFIKDGTALNRADFTNIQEFDRARIEAFVNDSISGLCTIEDGAFLATCLLEIGARKLFVNLPRRMSSMNSVKTLEKAFKEFIE